MRHTCLDIITVKKIVKMGVHLRKLSRNWKTGVSLFGPPYIIPLRHTKSGPYGHLGAVSETALTVIGNRPFQWRPTGGPGGVAEGARGW